MESIRILRKKLGAGAHGVVYAGLDESTGRLVAVKEIPCVDQTSCLPDETEPEMGRRAHAASFSFHATENITAKAIRNEISLLRQFHHPNLVQYYGVRSGANGVQVVMEFVGGGSLAQLLKRCGGQLGEGVARVYIRDVLLGLQYLHDTLRICHRDVKPGNILLTEGGHCKLTDFGVAKAIHDAEGPHAAFLHTTVGTPWYMAPEVIGEDVVDSAEDAPTATTDSAEATPFFIDATGQVRAAVETVAPSSAASSHSGSSSSCCSSSCTSQGGRYDPLRLLHSTLPPSPAGYTTSADIWSVGVTLFEMVSGKRPFGAHVTHPTAVLFNVVRNAGRPPQLPPGCPASPELQHFLDLCFVYDKTLRPSARELLRHRWMTGVGGPPPGASTAASPSPLSSSSVLSPHFSPKATGAKMKSQSSTPSAPVGTSRKVARQTAWAGVQPAAAQPLDALDLVPPVAHGRKEAPTASSPRDAVASTRSTPRALPSSGLPHLSPLQRSRPSPTASPRSTPALPATVLASLTASTSNSVNDARKQGGTADLPSPLRLMDDGFYTADGCYVDVPSPPTSS